MVSAAAITANWSSAAAAPDGSAWETVTNWTDNPVQSPSVAPGSTTDTTNTDIAQFGTAGATNLNVTVNANRTLGKIVFTRAGSYTIGTTNGSGLTLNTNGNSIEVLSGIIGTNTYTVAVPLTITVTDSVLASSSSDANTTLAVSGDIKAATAGLRLQLKGVNTGNNVFSGAYTGDSANSGSLIKVNNGTWVLSGKSTFVGATTINAGTLSVNTINYVTSGTLANPAGGSSLGHPTTAGNGIIQLGGTTVVSGQTVAVGGTLVYTGTGETTDRGFNLVNSGLGGEIDASGSGLLKFTATLNNGTGTAKTITFGGTGTGEYAGSINDNSSGFKTSVAKTGIGTWTISSSNISNTTNSQLGFTGTTSVTGGTLILANANAVVATASVDVGGGTLASSVATTNIGGNLNLTSGTISPGGTSLGQFALVSGKTFNMSGGTWAETLGVSGLDSISSAGGSAAFSITGGTLDLTGSTINYASTYNLLTGFASGSVAGLTIAGYDTANFTASLSSAGQLSFSPLPEPIAIGWLAVGGLLLNRRARRR